MFAEDERTLASSERSVGAIAAWGLISAISEDLNEAYSGDLVLKCLKQTTAGARRQAEGAVGAVPPVVLVLPATGFPTRALVHHRLRASA